MKLYHLQRMRVMIEAGIPMEKIRAVLGRALSPTEIDQAFEFVTRPQPEPTPEPEFDAQPKRARRKP